MTVKIEQPDFILPFRIAVCRQDEAGKLAMDVNAQHMISITEPGGYVLRPPSVSPERHLHLTFVDRETGDRGGPQVMHVRALLEFGKTIPEGETVIVHCHAGLRRSPAAAILLMCQAAGAEYIDDVLESIVRMQPHAMPNRRVVMLGDKLLGADRRIRKATEEFLRLRGG